MKFSKKLSIIMAIVFMLCSGFGGNALGEDLTELEAVPTPQPLNENGMPYLFEDLINIMNVNANKVVGGAESEEIMINQDFDFENYKNKLLLINFFTTWCPYCISEMPDLVTLQETYGDQLVVLLVHVPDRETEQKGIDFIKENGWDSLAYYTDTDYGLANYFGLSGYPFSIFMDETGFLLYYQPGALTYDLMVYAVESAGLSPIVKE